MVTITCGKEVTRTVVIKCTKCGSTKNMDKGETVPPCSKCANCTFTY